MNPDYGMQFGTTDAIHDPFYTTNQNRLQTNLFNPLGKQFDVISIPGGTAFSIDLSTVVTDTEQLFTITHGLGYVPQTYVVFSPILIGSGQTAGQTGYNEEIVILASGGTGTDVIDYTVNEDTFTINHTLTCDGSGSGSYTSTANLYTLQVKYLICNNTQIRTTVVY